MLSADSDLRRDILSRYPHFLPKEMSPQAQSSIVCGPQTPICRTLHLISTPKDDAVRCLYSPLRAARGGRFVALGSPVYDLRLE